MGKRRSSTIQKVKDEIAEQSFTFRGEEEEEQDSLQVEPSNTQRVEDGTRETSVEKEPEMLDFTGDEDEGEEGDGDGENEESEATTDEGGPSSQGLWSALEIIDETASQYYIRWAGKDEKGKPWSPTWEPKANANAVLRAEWKRSGKQRCKERKEKEKAEKKAKKQAEKERKQKAKAKKGRRTSKVKEESPQIEPMAAATASTSNSRETTESRESPAAAPPLVRPIKRKRNVVPDSDSQSSPQRAAEVEEPATKKQKKPTKKVTFEILIDNSSQVSSVSKASPQKAAAFVDRQHMQQEEEEAVEEEQELAPLASSTESSTSIIPDSQIVASKTSAFLPSSSPHPESQVVEETVVQPTPQDYHESTSNELHQVPSTAGPSRSRVFPAMESPATSHSELSAGSPHRDDDVPIFNDCSQQDEEAEEEEYDPLLFQLHRSSEPSNSTLAIVRQTLNPVRPPPPAAFFPAESQIASSQFDPIEDADSPRRSQQHRQRLGQDRQDRSSPIPISHPRPSKQRLELQLGPPEFSTTSSSNPVSSFEAEVEASAANSYVSQSITTSTTRPIVRSETRQVVKRAAARPLVVPTASIVVGVNGGETTAGSREEREDIAGIVGEEEEEDDGFSSGGINDDFFAEGLANTQKPLDLDFDEFVDFDGAEASRTESQAVDGAEQGSYGGGGGHSNGQSQQPQYSNNVPSTSSSQTPIPGFIASGPSSVAGTGFAGSNTNQGGASGNGGGGGGYPFPAHLQSSHGHSGSSGKREYEDERDERAKRARFDEENRRREEVRQRQEQHRQIQHHQQQQQQQYHRQQATGQVQQFASSPQAYYSSQYQPYPQHPHPSTYRPPSNSAPNPPPPSGGLQYRSVLSQAAHPHLPPMQHTPPPGSDYSRSSNQLPPIQQALSNSGYAHSPPSVVAAPRPIAPGPTVSVAAASPPPPSAAATAPPPAASASTHLTSPSIARVQNMDPHQNAPQRSPSPSSSKLAPTSNSRTSSPAPTLSTVDDLVALVRASTSIEDADGTKLEIEKFLRDSRTYGEVAENPLCSAPFWAFELRRQGSDTGDKVDFIILHTREGKYQLKRCAASSIPVEFARSWKHAPARERGLTPAVDAVPTLHASSSGPPAPASMSRDQLEQELESLRKRLAEQETELIASRPLVAETAKLKVEVQTLTNSVKQIKNSRDLVQQDMQYMQEQYSAASTAATERAREAAIAEAETARLNVLLKDGLQQKEKLYKAEISKSKMEMSRMKKEVALVKAEQRKIHESKVVDKAAKWDEMVARLESKRVKKVERQQRIEAGGEPEDEEDLDSEEEIVSNLLLAGRKKSTPPPPRSPPISKIVPDSIPVSTQSTLDPSTEADSTTANEHRCNWHETQSNQSNLVPCDVVLPSRDALLQHVLTHAP